MQKHLLRTALSLIGLAPMAMASTAFAQAECEQDTCPAGYTCKVDSYENCTWECDDSDRMDCEVSSCETVEYTSCERSVCETDEDCGGDMVCHETTGATCTEPAAPDCAPGEACEEVPPSACTTIEFKQCTPRAELPCEESSDCGDGYDCVPSVMCTCSGGSAVPDPGTPAPPATAATPTNTPAPSSTAVPVEGDVAPSPAPPDDCTCSPSGTNYCQMKTIECTADADCPTDWTCEQFAGECWADSEGNTGCSEGPSQCYPAGTPGSTPGPVVPDAPPTAGGGDPTGTPETEPPVDDDDDHGSSPGGRPHRPHHQAGQNPFHRLLPLWGCSVEAVGTSGTSSPWTLLSVGLGAALLRRRRR